MWVIFVFSVVVIKMHAVAPACNLLIKKTLYTGLEWIRGNTILLDTSHTKRQSKTYFKKKGQYPLNIAFIHTKCMFMTSFHC